MQPYLTYTPALLLISGFCYLTYRNSPKHATLFLLVVAISVLVGFIEPRQTFTLIGLTFGIIGVFVVMIQSRNVRERDLRNWLAENGFQRIEFKSPKSLFNTVAIGTSTYSSYQVNLSVNQEIIPCLAVLRYSTSNNNNSVQIVLDFSYYFPESANIVDLEQRSRTARDKTPHTNLWKSQLRFFDLKDCEIFRPNLGGLVVSWRTPASVQGYTERYVWLRNALQQ